MAYISIRDFSQRAGVSPQAIYQRLDKDLSNYIKVVETRKMIEESALELFSVKEPLKQVDKEVDKQIDKELTSTLQETIKILSAQLTEKDEQIREKDNQIRRKDDQIEALNQRLAEAFELNKNSQVLIARGQEIKQIETQTEDPETDQDGREKEREDMRSQAPEPEKKSFWQRFRKKK